MSVKIKLKQSPVPGDIPDLTDLDLGELSINTFDGKVFTKKDDGVEQSIVEIGSQPTGGISTVFYTTDGMMVTVTNGIITGISAAAASPIGDAAIGSTFVIS